jgi:transposase
MIDRLSTTRSLTSISKEFSCSVTTVQRVLDFVPEPVSKPLPHVLGIDEFKGNTDKEKYQCILVDLENGTVFDVLPTRKKPDLINYFKKYSNRTEVRYFVMDMTNNYRDLDFLFPNATVIADKFHYIRQVYWGLDNVRKRIQKEYSKNKRIYFKHSRKLLFKDLEDLKEEEKEELQIMLSQSDDLYRAWVLKDNFKYFRQAKTREEAERELHIWIGSAEESGFEEFKNAITAFRNWRVEILNSVIYPYSNGQTEGFNNKIKVLKRNAYGFRKFKNLRKRIQLNCIKDGNQAVA